MSSYLKGGATARRARLLTTKLRRSRFTPSLLANRLASRQLGQITSGVAASLPKKN